MPLSQTITTLTVTAVVGDSNFAGTTDSIGVTVGSMNHQIQELFDSPAAGERATIKIDLPTMFRRAAVNLSEIDHISLTQTVAPHPIASDDWELGALWVTANDTYENSFLAINQWLKGPKDGKKVVWSSSLPIENWLTPDDKPCDFDGATYPVGLIPYLGDIRRWRSYDPSTIDGIGQLVGMRDGKIIGEQLKTRQCEELRATDQGHTYTWVFVPKCSILYWWWDKNDSVNYVRHSQLGSGAEVICAGEMELNRTSNGPDEVATVIAMVNDASGHYKPDGGACLQYVQRKLDHLGIPTEPINWKWRDS